MRPAFLAVLLCGSAAAAPRALPRDPSAWRKLHSIFQKGGSYRVSVSGVLCNACTKAVLDELGRTDGVAEASFDYEDGFLRLKIGPARNVRISQIERALRKAYRVVRLGARFEIVNVERLDDPSAAKTPAPPAAQPR